MHHRCPLVHLSQQTMHHRRPLMHHTAHWMHHRQLLMHFSCSMMYHYCRWMHHSWVIAHRYVWSPFMAEYLLICIKSFSLGIHSIGMGIAMPPSGLVPYQNPSFDFSDPVEDHMRIILGNPSAPPLPVTYHLAPGGYDQGFVPTSMNYPAGGFSGTGTNWNFTGLDLSQFNSVPVSNEHSTGFDNLIHPEVWLPAPPPVNKAPATTQQPHDNTGPSSSEKHCPKPWVMQHPSTVCTEELAGQAQNAKRLPPPESIVMILFLGCTLFLISSFRATSPFPGSLSYTYHHYLLILGPLTFTIRTL